MDSDSPPPLPKAVSPINGQSQSAAGGDREPPLLPNETLVAIFAELGLPDLLTLRRASRRFKALAEFLLADLLHRNLVEQRKAKKVADMAMRDLEREKKPRMQHYRTFLQPLTFQEINELRFMRDPPHEVRIVCACLSLLYRLPDPALELNIVQACDWNSVRKVMASRAFRAWLVNLEPGVDEVALANVRPVEKIIMNDHHISYQNVRRINLPAYKLLIVVAAIIQIVNIQDELTNKSRVCRKADSKLARTRYLLNCIGGPRRKGSVEGAAGVGGAAAWDVDVDEDEVEGKEPPSRADTDATIVDDDNHNMTHQGIQLTDGDFVSDPEDDDNASVFEHNEMDFEMETVGA